MKTLRALTGVVCLWTFAFDSGVRGQEGEQRLRRSEASAPGVASFVNVTDGPLFFSRQVMARNVSANAAAQAQEALDQLIQEVAAAGGSLSTIARLNAYVAHDDDWPAVLAVVASRFKDTPVSLTWVTTSFVEPGARVAFDAVASVATGPDKVVVTPAGGAVLPAGAKVFLSGLIERGDDMAASVQKTMDGLDAMLRHLDLSSADVVQVKVFLQPLAAREQVQQAIAARFASGAVPPVVWVEWTQPLHVEIEMVASAVALRAQPTEGLTFPAIPGRPSTGRYSHVAVVAAGTPLIFLGGLSPAEGLAPRAQWRDVFATLGGTLFDAGSSFRQLVKATYYTSDPEARRVLNEIRPVYYDPQRPPSASAISVRGVAQPGRAVHLDLIAVPLPAPQARPR